MPCHPWSHPLVGHPVGKAKQGVGLLLPTAVLGLPECMFSAAVGYAQSCFS